MTKENVIYISSQNIQVISGSAHKSDMIKVEQFHSFPIGEGSMINGIIMSEEAVIEVLQKVKELGIKASQLVLDSGQILLKNVEVPLLNKKELLQFTKDELSSIEGNYTDLLYDYCILENLDAEHKMGEIMCCGIERRLIRSYVDLFKKAGIKLEKIDIAINAIRKLTQEFPEFTDKSYIISLLDGNNVSSILFEHNKYAFSKRSRLFSTRGSEAFTSEMVSNISQLQQFSKSRQSDYPVEVAYFCNLDEGEETLVYERVQHALHIKAERFPNSAALYVCDSTKKDDFQLHQYILPVAELIRK